MTSAPLVAMRCRRCNQMIEPDVALLARLGRRRTATSFANCAYKCSCGAAYSNRRDERGRTLIVEQPEMNVPAEVRPGVAALLDLCVNVRNRRNKKAKFCFGTSEDAVTWTIFNALAVRQQLSVVLEAVGLQTADDSPELLLWGVPRVRGQSIAAELAAVCARLRENPRSLTEPDVVIGWPDILVVIEVKYRDGNDVQPDHGQFDRYLDRPELFAESREEVIAAGYYELVRNWRIGVELAERSARPRFALINLGPQGLAASSHGLSDLFECDATRSFHALSWASLLRSARIGPAFPPWLDDFVSERELESRWG